MDLYGVHSEVGKLRKVIVHRPELSLKRLTPANHDELLFDDVLWVERAQWEHDQFVDCMRERGVEVFYVQDLLTETLAASQDARRLIIEQVATDYTVGWSLVDEIREFLWGLPADFLARHLIGGLTAGETDLDWGKFSQISLSAAALEDMNYFLLPPLPNTLFTRDSSCWIYDGVSVNPMYWPARRRESLNMFAIYRYHPMFKDAGFNFWYPKAADGPFKMEEFRAFIPRRRRRPADRQRHGVDRHVRAHPGRHDRADRRSTIRPRQRRTGHRLRDDARPRPHAPGYGLHHARPRQSHRFPQGGQPDPGHQPAPRQEGRRFPRDGGERPCCQPWRMRSRSRK